MLNLSGQAGNWSADFTDYAIISANGDVHPIYVGGSSISLGSWGGNVTNMQYAVQPVSNTQPHYYMADHLGSTRMEFAGGGWPVAGEDYAPYGQEVTPQSTQNHYKFTGYERDPETGNDYAQARYYTSQIAGRFMSPDPYAGSMNLANPQSFNRYTYALNNPVKFADPSGLYTCIYDLGGGSYSIYYDEAGGCGGDGFYDPSGGSDVEAGALPGSISNVSFDNNGDLYSFDLDGVFTLATQQNAFNGPSASQDTLGGTAFSYFGGVGPAPNGSTASAYFVFAPGYLDKGPTKPLVDSHWLDKWPLNGNMIPLKPGKQDNKCTTGPLEGPMDRNPAVLSCCVAHDDCYQAHGCNMTSWVPNPLPAGVCNACNAKAAACITGAVLGH